MYRCAQCGSQLQSEKQSCPRCGEQRAAPVLPTLYGFGDDSEQDALKTVQMTYKPKHSSSETPQSRSIHQTEPLISPIPMVPNHLGENTAFLDDFASFDSDDSTEITSGQANFNKNSFSSVSELATEISHSEPNHDYTLSEGFNPEDNFEDIDSANDEFENDFEVSMPPPIPPPSDSLGGIHLRGVPNPFATGNQQFNQSQLQAVQSANTQPQLKDQDLSASILWFSQHKALKQRLKQQESLLLPITQKKVGKVHLSQQGFSFEGALNQEIWQPVKKQIEMTQMNTLRSGSLIIKWVEMTVENTEVISQPSMAIWELKANQERVFYGAFNLFPGVSRVGGELCEISLPFVKSKGPIFTVELDLNGHLWAQPHGQRELWSLIQSADQFPYGQILATQGKLFTLLKG